MSRATRSNPARPPRLWILATQPGLGKLAATDVRDAGARVDGIESDGRSDLVVFEATEPPPERSLTLAEDLFFVVGTTHARADARAVATRLFNASQWQDGADRAKENGARVGATTGFRVITRVRSERDFKRTELRESVIDLLRRWRPRWRVSDPADLEFWVLETRKGTFRAAVRLSSPHMRSRGGRIIEREGALRPTVAAALVRAVGTPRGLLFDPFCGSGTVLGEARRAGWRAAGSDFDPKAVEAARANQPDVEVVVADATDLPLANGAAAAIATNAPFGVQHMPQTGGKPLELWWQAVVTEMVRVVTSHGALSILHPDDHPFTHALRQADALRQLTRTPIRTLGQPAVIWTLERV
jgi:23S rRNA G2445 N2-methylase RlmL